jgi:regulator of cell morphogenesis and NO signaling
MEGIMNTTAEGREQLPGWTSAPLSALIRHILDTHHTYLRGALPKLSQLVLNAAPVAGSDQDEVLLEIAQVYRDLRSELESHMWKEEMVLFPLIEGLKSAEATGQPAPASHCGSVRNPIRVMQNEHGNAKHALTELRRLTGGFIAPAGASTNFRNLLAGLAELETDLYSHIHLEDDILFPRAGELEDRLAHAG